MTVTIVKTDGAKDGKDKTGLGKKRRHRRMKEAGGRRGYREENEVLDIHNRGDCEETGAGRDSSNRSPIDV